MIKLMFEKKLSDIFFFIDMLYMILGKKSLYHEKQKKDTWEKVTNLSKAVKHLVRNPSIR